MRASDATSPQREQRGVEAIEEDLRSLKDRIAAAAIDLANLESCHQVDPAMLADQDNLRRLVRWLARQYGETLAEWRRAQDGGN